jgi:restriction system protein
MKKRTIKEAIVDVLRKVGTPLSPKEIYNKIIELDYYRFNSETPLHIVSTELRRHSKGIDFPAAHKKKHFQFLNNGTYWIVDLPVPNLSTQSLKAEIVVRKDSENLKSVVEDLKEIHSKHTEAFKKQILNQLKEIDPRIFEEFSKKLLKTFGFKDLAVTQQSKDGGIDGYGKLKVGITFLNVAFQSKRWNKTVVSKKEIQSFRGDIQGKYEQGIYFTTSTYSRDAKEVSIQKGAVPIILLDGNAIVEIMIEKQFGVDTENIPVYVNALDKALNED